MEKLLKEIAYSCGCDVVGIGQTALSPYQSCIVVGKLLPVGLRQKGFPAVASDYLRIFQKTNRALAQMEGALANKGFRTNRQSIFSITGDIRPLAERAGLGSKGANEMVLNPKFGSNLLYAAIHTDCPLEQDERVDGICRRCFRCRDFCPAGALTDKGLNVARCLPYSLQACQKCLDVCPVGALEYKCL